MVKISTLRSYKINQLGNITIPTLISSAGNSQNYIFSETDDIYFEAEIYLNSYDITNPILSSMNTESNIINEFLFFIAGVDEVGGRGIPAGSFVVYNGERGTSLSCHYTDSAIISLNTWTKVTAKRTNGIWSLFINDIACSVSRFDDGGVPNDQFGNENLFVYIGRSEADDLNLDGQIKNIILGNKLINSKISIKKQNQTKLEPYSIDGGSTVYDANNIYIFKGGSINTLGAIFNLIAAGAIESADIISFNGNSYYKKTGGFTPGGWRDQNSIRAERYDTVIAPGTLIYFNPRSYKTTVVATGAIIEKYNTPAKISLRPTCGYQNTNKLIEISGNNAPIAAIFNDIAFDYSSFADRCLSLGLDPATILNSLGGVDFNYNYVVIRAKTSSNFTSDSISDLGNGVINITTIGPSTGTVANRYRFFVMCKTGWKIVRFYGTDYNIKNNLNLLISDITNYQTNTIGELHYNDNISMKSIFTTDDSYKVVKNEILASNNRINYNIGYIPNQFTAIFDYKAGGGNGADGGYFYLFAKGTQSPNMGDSDSFPIGKYFNDPDNDAYRIHFEEYVGNQQLAVSWGGYDVDLIASVGSVADNPLGLNFADGTWRTIKIKFNQGTFEIYINNTLKLSCVDSNYNNRDKSGTNFGLGGYVGGYNNYHYFKNFRFYDYLRD